MKKKYKKSTDRGFDIITVKMKLITKLGSHYNYNLHKRPA